MMRYDCIIPSNAYLTACASVQYIYGNYSLGRRAVGQKTVTGLPNTKKENSAQVTELWLRSDFECVALQKM